MIVRTMNSRISIDLVVKSGVKRHGYIEMEMVDRLRHPVVLWEYHRQPHIFVVDEHCPTIRKGHGIYIDIYIYISVRWYRLSVKVMVIEKQTIESLSKAVRSMDYAVCPSCGVALF